MALATAAIAQQPAAQPDSTAALNLPQNPQVFGAALPSVVKATAIVNGEVITQTDIDQRLALMSIANNAPIPADEIERLRQQILSNLIDETLQIQAAKAEEIEITDADIDKTVRASPAANKQTPDQMADYLKSRGSSMKAIRRQIMGEMAWRRLQSKKIESTVSVGDDEVQAVIQKLEASKGTQEFRVGEIFISATSANDAQALAKAQQVLQALQQGGSFVGYARQVSEASTAAVGGDLGWVRPEQLPDELGNAVRQMRPGMVSAPIKVAGGYSIVAVQDVRKILTADPRDSVLTLKQVTVAFPAGTTRPQAEPIVARFAQAAQNIGGCGGAGADCRRTQCGGRAVRRRQDAGLAARAAGNVAADAGRPRRPARLDRSRRVFEFWCCAAATWRIRPCRALTRCTPSSTKSASTCAHGDTCVTLGVTRSSTSAKSGGNGE